MGLDLEFEVLVVEGRSIVSKYRVVFMIDFLGI